MSTDYTNTIALAAPANQITALANTLAALLVRPMADFALRAGYGPTLAGPVTVYLGSGVFTDIQVDQMRDALSPGGVLYLLGCRARRLLNEATETTTNEPNKLQVTVYDVGDPPPVGIVDWTVSRVTLANFLVTDISGVVRIQSAI